MSGCCGMVLCTFAFWMMGSVMLCSREGTIKIGNDNFLERVELFDFSMCTCKNALTLIDELHASFPYPLHRYRHSQFPLSLVIPHLE